MDKARTTANTYEHPTPDALFVALSAEFGPFDYDPATRPEYFTARHVKRFSTLAGTFYNSEFVAGPEPRTYAAPLPLSANDGLREPWIGRVYCNPPYGRDMWRWIKKAYDATRPGGTAEIVVMLLPVRSDLRWWAKYVAQEIQRNNLPPHQWFVDADGHEPADVVRFIRGRVRYPEFVCVACRHEHLEGTCEAPYAADVGLICQCSATTHEVNPLTNAAPFPSVIVAWRRP